MAGVLMRCTREPARAHSEGVGDPQLPIVPPVSGSTRGWWHTDTGRSLTLALVRFLLAVRSLCIGPFRSPALLCPRRGDKRHYVVWALT